MCGFPGLLLAALLASSAVAAAVAAGKKAGPPDGKAVFLKHCAACHGAGGEGKDGPPLRGLRHSVAEIQETVREGVPGDMPGFRKTLNAEQIAAVSEYARQLQMQPR